MASNTSVETNDAKHTFGLQTHSTNTLYKHTANTVNTAYFFFKQIQLSKVLEKHRKTHFTAAKQGHLIILLFFSNTYLQRSL